MTSKTVPKNAAFFRTLAESAPECLDAVLAGTQVNRDRQAIAGLVQYLEEDGFPLQTSQSMLWGNNAIKQTVNGEAVVASLSSVVLSTLAPDKAESFSDAAREEALGTVDRLVAVYNKDAMGFGKKKFLNDMLFQAAGTVHDHDFATGLIKRGADANTEALSRSENSPAKIFVFMEAVVHGNAAVASAIAPSVWPSLQGHMLNHIVNPSGSQKNEKAALVGMAKALRLHSQDAFELIKAIESHFEPYKTNELRAHLLCAYLGDSFDYAVPWKNDVVLGLVGEPGSPQTNAMQAEVALSAKNLPTSSDEVDVWRQLIGKALVTHCHEVVGLFSAHLHEQAVHATKIPRNALSLVFTKSLHPSFFDAKNFQATIETLVSKGIKLDNAILGHTPAVHLLAKTNEDASVRAAKLAILLGMGVDPHQKSATGSLATSHLKKSGLPEWEGVVRSFEARSAANSILLDIEACELPMKMSSKP